MNEHECNKRHTIDKIEEKLDKLEDRIHDGDILFHSIEAKMDTFIETQDRIEKKVDYTNGCVGKHDGYFKIMKWSIITGVAVFVFMVMVDKLGWAEAVIEFGSK